MPRVKWRLTKAEKTEHLARAEWLNAAGTAIEVPENLSRESSALVISQYGPEFNNLIVNLNPGRVVLLVDIRLLALQSGIRICDCQISSSWEDSHFFLWGTSDETADYRLAPELEFPRDQVLNHRIEEGMPLRRGIPVEGLVILMEFAPLAEKFRHDMRVNVTLDFVDQFGGCFPTKAKLRVARDIESAPRHEWPKERRGLFDDGERETVVKGYRSGKPDFSNRIGEQVADARRSLSGTGVQHEGVERENVSSEKST